MVSVFKPRIAIIGAVVTFVAAGLLYAYSDIVIDTNIDGRDDPIIAEDIQLSAHEKIHVIHTSRPEKGLLIYIAHKDHAKHNEQVAKQFAALSYYVAVVDSQALLTTAIHPTTQCLNLAQTLTNLSTQLQTHFKLDADTLPILVGSDAGAATVYAALAQADKHQFHAAVSINFSPNLKSHTPLCNQHTFASAAQHNLLQLTAVKRLPTSFYVFQDKNSTAGLADSNFTDRIGNVKLTLADDKEQTSLAEAIQILQWLDPRLADQISSDASDSDLPLIEIPAKTPADVQADSAAQENSATSSTVDTMAIIITGDGGWAAIDKNLANILAAQGIPTVALDSLSYFWKARTVAETSHDIEAVMTQYLEKWNKKKVLLIGYSFGADVLPFVANNLTTDAQQKISVIALLGMGKTAAFEFRLSSWMNADKNPNRLPLLPEIEKMKWANSICIYGVEDEAANCLPTAALGVKIISMSGDHHFDEKYDELVKHIIENQKSLP